jgi:predicted nucleic acid-binding protein
VAVTHLLDTSVLKRLGHPDVRTVVETLAARGQLARPTICDLEVGYSARNAGDWDDLLGALSAFVAIETTAAHLRRALQVQRLLAERSQRGRKIPDLLVAAAAEEQALTVLHYNSDFDLISQITGQPSRWVVASGTIA